MTANGSKSFLGYLNNFVEEYNKKSIDVDSYFSEKFESIHKAPKFKVGDRVKIVKYKNISAKVILKNGQKQYMWLILWWELILGPIRLKI